MEVFNLLFEPQALVVLAIIAAVVEALKAQLHLEPQIQFGVALLVGTGIGAGYLLTTGGVPTEPANIFWVIVSALAVGLTATGAYDLLSIFRPATPASPPEQK